MSHRECSYSMYERSSSSWQWGTGETGVGDCIVRSFGSAWKAFISHVGNNEVDYNRWRIAIDEM